ncbi:MAG: transposase [Nitrososphaerales archaeon]
MLAAEVPSPFKGLLKSFNGILSKPQQRNLASLVLGFIAAEGEKNVKGMANSLVPYRNQSSLNRFITDAKWDYRALNYRRLRLVEKELGLSDNSNSSDKQCYFIVDDTTVEKYGGEVVGYHHDSKHGLIRGHCYVTGLCVCSSNSKSNSNGRYDDDAWYPTDLKLYMPAGSSPFSKERLFRSKIDLACELIDEFSPPGAGKEDEEGVMVSFDEWYFCSEVVKHAEGRGFQWTSEAKSNRIILYQDERLHVGELADIMKPFFRDVEVDGELYQCCDLQVYMPRIGKVRLVFNCKADTKDMHNMCTSITNESEPFTANIVKRSLKRSEIESFYWDVKNVIGFGEYRFRESEAAIVHSHLVFLVYTLLQILKKRMESRDEERREVMMKGKGKRCSIGEACAWLRDRCLLSFCIWIKDKLAAGLDITKIAGMIRPQICK